jgi:CHAT domain-containing protein/tetratricopeptide (TPR) repeat protein
VKNCFLISLLFCLSIGFSQSKLAGKTEAILLQKENQLIDDKQTLNQLLVLFSKQNKTAVTPEMGQLLAEIGKGYYKIDNNPKAIFYLQKAIAIQKRFKKSQLEVLNKTRNNLAWIYSYENNDNDRYTILKQIISDNGQDKYTFNAIIDCSILEARRGDFFTAFKRLNLALAQSNSMDENIRIRSTIIGVYGKMYENVFVPKKTSDLEIIKRHEKFIENQFDNTTLSAGILFATYNNLANVYEAFGEQKNAIRLYFKVRDYYHQQGDTEKLYSVVNNIGYLYSKQEKHAAASLCYKQVIAHSNDPAQIATAYDNMGYFLPNSTAEQKIPYFQKAIQNLIQSPTPSFSLPSLEAIRSSGYPQDVLVYMVDLASHYVQAYKASRNRAYLQQAKQTLYRVDELVSLIRYESNSELSKLFWIEKGVNSYLLAVEVCYLLERPYEAFYFMEKNKALLLQENIKTLQAKFELSIPQSLQKREYQLHYELVVLEKQFQQNPSSVSLKKKYLNKNKEYSALMQSLRMKYPEYTRIKKGIAIVTLQKEIDKLHSNECFVSYILNESKGYGVFCTRKQLFFFPLSDVRTLQKNIPILQSLMQQPILTTAEKVRYQKLSYATFKALFPFKNASSWIRNKKLTIVPDETLSNFPFEALTVQQTGSLSADYLLQQTEVVYLQSFSVFERIQSPPKKADKNIMFINPTAFHNQNLPALKASKQLIQTVEQFDQTDVFSGDQATKEQFYDFCSKYAIIHLNTHADVDSVSELPWIAFQDGKLRLNELYGIHNQAELVILDACKTNEGTLASGEGILSLSRGFFYNGSKSVMASLWNVNEKAGNEIITSFYTFLNEGKSKSKALQLAKLNYLKQHEYSEVLPYYWASFTLTGSTTPIVIPHKTPLIFFILPILIVLIAIYFAKRKQLFKKNK